LFEKLSEVRKNEAEAWRKEDNTKDEKRRDDRLQFQF
jgi:hypothetical protein